MKKRINPFYILYEILFFFPLFLISTIITAITTIVMSAIFGDTKWGYYPARWWSKFTCAIALLRVEIIGEELLDQNQSYVFVANHQSVFDIFLIYGWLPNKFKWIMKKEIKKIPLVGKACEYAGHIFLDRTNKRAAARSIELAAKKLTNGVSVVIFPEGTRTHDGTIGKFRRGAFLLATDIKLPLVPITIKGAFEVLPRNTFLMHPGKITMVIHKPIATESYSHDNINELINKTHEIIKEEL